MTFAKALIKSVILALFASLVPGMYLPAANATTCAQFKIGYQGPLTGPEASIGIAQRSGVILALQKFLAANPSLSNISNLLVSIDDQGDPAVAPTAVQTALNDPCLIGVVGPAYSGAAKASLKWYESKGVPVITPSAIRATDLSIYGPSVFNRLAPLYEELLTQAIPELVDTSGNGKVAYFYDEQYLSPSLSTYVPKNLEVWTYQVGNNDAATIETKFAQAKAAGATKVILDSYFLLSSLATVVEKAKSAGFDIILGPTFDLSFVESLLPNSNFEGVKLFSGSYRFKDLGSTLQSDNSESYAPLTFDAAYFMLTGMKNGATSPSQLSTFIRTHLFNGTTGEFAFSSNGEKLPSQLPRFQITSNQIVPLNPAETRINGALTAVPRANLQDNFKFIVSEWDGGDTDYQSYIFSSTFRNGLRQEAGIPTRLRLDNGTHIFEVYPASDPQSLRSRRQIYEVIVNSGLVSSVKNISSSSATSIPISGDTYILKLASKNTEVTLDSIYSLSGGTLLIEATNFGIKSSTNQKKLSFNLDESKIYNFTIYAPSESWKLAHITSIENVSLTGSPPYQISLAPELANVIGTVDPMPASGGTAQLLKDDGTGIFSPYASRTISESGKVGFKVPAGSKVKVRFIPSDNQLGEVTTIEYTVPSSGILETSAIAFLGQNVSGTISLAGGGVMSNGYYEVVKTSVSPNVYVYDGTLSSSGQYAVRLAVGTYKISAYPNGQPEYKEVTFNCVVSDVNIATVCNAETTRKKVVGTLTLPPNETFQNFSLHAFSTGGEGRGSSQLSASGRYGLEIDSGSYIMSAKKWVYENLNNVEREYNYDRGYFKCEILTVPATCDATLTPNFSYTVTDHQGLSLKEKASITIRYRFSSNTSVESLKTQYPQLQRFQLNEVENVSLPDGEHLVSVEKGTDYSSSLFNNISYFLIKVSSGSIESIRNLQSDSLITAVNGVFALQLRAPNFIGQFLDNQTTSEARQVIFTRLSDNRVEHVYKSGTFDEIELQLVSGSYRIEVSPKTTTSTRATSRHIITVSSNGTVTFAKEGDSTPITAVGGKFPVRFSVPNLVGKMTLGGTARSGDISWRKFVPEGNYWSWSGWQNINSTGQIYGNFTPGRYRPLVSYYSSADDNYRTLIGPECVVPQSGSVTCDIAIPNATLTSTMSSNNIILKSEIYASVKIDSSDVSDSFETCCVSPNQVSGKFDFSLLDGSYVITFSQEKAGGANSRSYGVVISNQLVTSFTDKITGASITPVDGVYSLSFLQPNLSGVIKNIEGSAIDFEGSGATLVLEKWIDEKYWGGVKKLWLSNANYEMRVDGLGKYRLRIYPNNSDLYSSSISSEFYVNSSSEVSIIANSGFSPTLTNFHVTLNSNNLLLKVLNPIDDKPLASGYVYIYKKNNSGDLEYQEGLGIWAGRNGLIGTYLAAGNYQLDLNVYGSSQLFSRSFDVEVIDTSTITVKADGVAVSKDSNRFVIKPFTTNVKGRILDPNGSVFGSVGNQSVYVNVQQKSEDGTTWQYNGKGSSVDADGYFGLKLGAVGKYRLSIEPYGSSSVAQTFSDEFEITSSNLSSFSKDFESIRLRAPNFKIAIFNSDTGTALTNIYVAMYKVATNPKEGKWQVKGLNPDSEGIASGYVSEEGQYEFEVYPPWNSTIEGATRKTYSATVTKDSNNNYVLTFDAVSGVSVVNGVTRLRLGGSNLRGVVYKDDGTTPVANSQVVPYKITSDGEIPMWDLATWSSSLGKWSINLPEGSFKIKAQTPYEIVDQSHSLRSGLIVVGPNGAVTSYPAGKNPLDFSVNLRTPTWKGVLKSPTGDEVIANSYICLNYRISANTFRGECSRTDAQGRFGISIPEEGNYDAETTLTFGDSTGKYPELRLVGKTQIEASLGVSATNVTVNLPAANIKVTVTGGGAPQQGVWVSVERPGVEWVGGKSTDAQGVAGVYSSNTTDAFQVSIWVPTQNSAVNQQYVSTIKYYSAPDIAAAKINGIFQSTVALPVPNIRGAIRTPAIGNAASALAPGSYLNVLDTERGEWMPGVSVSADGTFAMFLRGGCCESKTYSLIVEPGYDKDGKLRTFVRNEYIIEVSTTNVATIKDKRTGAVVGTETLQGMTLSTIYLGTPNLTGVVVNPSNQTVSGSQIYAWGKCDSWWSCYQYSDSNGSFGLSLEDGDFTIGARTPWGNSDFADSEQCVITVSGTTVSNKSGNCIQSDGKAKLALRNPNFSFTLMDGSAPVRNAYVNMYIGNWWAHARTDDDGKVAILVSDQEIASRNQGIGETTFTPYISVWLSGKESNVISWSCKAGDSKPICDQLTNYTIGTPFGTKNLGNVPGATFNTKIKVVSPDVAKPVGRWAYVEVIRFDQGYDNWLGWGETNSEGYARFYIESSTALTNAKFKVRVIPPYEYRSLMTEKVWDNSGNGYALSQLNNLELTLGTPNFKLAVVSPNGSTPNRWGWYSIEQWNSATSTYNWVTSSGIDYSGLAATNLQASKQYRLVAYPGGGRSGSATTCIVLTDTSTVVSLAANQCIGGTVSSGTLTLQLARGNVVGTVLAPDGTTPIAGAIVYANIVGATNEDRAVVTCTVSDGTYGFTLDPSYQWNIRVFPANSSTGPQYANKTNNSPISPQNNVTTIFNITLDLKTP